MEEAGFATRLDFEHDLFLIIFGAATNCRDWRVHRRLLRGVFNVSVPQARSGVSYGTGPMALNIPEAVGTLIAQQPGK